MSETVKHTPGPWQIDRKGPLIIKSIGPCTPDEYAGSAWLEVSEADARLIAAAPDLLDAAKTAYEWMNNLPVPTSGCTAKMQVLYNALAKAGG